jgi:hypothetical protein
MLLWVVERQGIRAPPDIGEFRLETQELYLATGKPDTPH